MREMESDVIIVGGGAAGLAAAIAAAEPDLRTVVINIIE